VVIDHLGVSDGYYDIAGAWHPTSDETRAALHAAMGEPGQLPGMWFVPVGHSEAMWSGCRVVLEDGADIGVHHHLPGDLPVGYHALHPVNGSPGTTVVVHPERCPEAPRAWGVAAQAYALWGEQTWGVGDLRDVATLGCEAADRGAGVLLLSPLHAPAPTTDQENSPYSPSSRCWWNPLLLPIDEPRPAELTPDPARLIDRDAVWVAKRAALWRMFEQERADPGWREWAGHIGRGLDLFGAWGALAERHGAGWQAWPSAVREPGPSVLAHVYADDELAAAAEFHIWCQWRLHGQLQQLAPGRGPIGLIGDMAVGFTPQGFDAWRFQHLLAAGDVRIGAPPDLLAPDGQNWGLPPLVPWKTRAARYEPLIDTLRAVFTGMAGIRIDHVMGLFRQYWTLPEGGGAYVHFPADELLAIVSVEAHRAGAFVIGEDLGTVPPEVPPAMRSRGMLGTRVVVLDELPPAEWPDGCVATLTTHDLPTMAGVMTGDGPDEMRERLALALGADGAAAAIAGVRADDDAPAMRQRLIDALHRSLIDSPARLRLVTTDDLCGTPLRENVPGTVGPPNWCRSLPHPVHDLPWTGVTKP
jgi:4-alpha-glucanotransferase